MSNFHRTENGHLFANLFAFSIEEFGTQSGLAPLRNTHPIPPNIFCFHAFHHSSRIFQVQNVDVRNLPQETSRQVSRCLVEISPHSPCVRHDSISDLGNFVFDVSVISNLPPFEVEQPTRAVWIVGRNDS